LLWLIWLIVALAAVIGEVLTTGLFLASLAVAAAVVAALSLAVPPAAQVTLFGILSLLLLIVVRPLALRALPVQTEGESRPRIGPIGQEGVAVERIDSRQGQIRIGAGEFWTARPLEPGTVIPAGSEVEVVRLDGLVARVQPVGPRELETANGNPFGLSARELEVLRLIADGKTNAEIASELYLSPRTVDHHVSHILTKMNASSRAEAVRLAVEHGLA
jgi:DNA-binding CsgD family transcriptional regulator/membrane protein implicated in regulation of membrane protease activity